MTTAETITPSQPCIVAGFDNTPSGYDAVALGAQLAAAAGARLIVAHAYVNVVGTTDAVLNSQVAAQSHEAALRRLDRARVVLHDLATWEAVAYAAAPAARALHELAERYGAELIVVGSTHRHGLGRVMPGTTAERLLYGSGFPIVVAPAGWRGAALRMIGAGFDGSDESGAALRAAATFAQAARASLRVLSVFEAPNPANPVYAVTTHGYTEIMGELREERRRQLDEAIEALPIALDCTAEVVDGNPAERLAAESEQLDLLVIGSRGYGALRATLAGTVAHQLASTSHCPLLLVPRGVEHPLSGLAPRRRRQAAH